MNNLRPPARDSIAKVWDLYCKLQVLDRELLSLNAEEAEHVERAKTIMTARDDLWKDKCAITNHIAGIDGARKKRKLGDLMDKELDDTQHRSNKTPTRRRSREDIFDFEDNLEENQSDYEDDNDSEYGDEPGEDGARTGRHGGVRIELDAESQHALDLQAQIQAELFPPQASSTAGQETQDKADSEVEEDFELMEIDANAFNTACQKTSMERENKQLRRKLEKAEKRVKLLYPLVVIGIQIRRRHLEHVGVRFGLRKEQKTIEYGNRAAHEANVLADMAMLDELGQAGTRYHQAMRVIYQSIWSPRDTPGWEDIAWDDKNCDLLSIQATCRQENIDHTFLQPQLGALLARIKVLAESVGSRRSILTCSAKRAKINLDPQVQDLLLQLSSFLRKNVGNRRPRVFQRPFVQGVLQSTSKT